MGKRTPFFELHLQSNAKIVDFAGWDMPLHYGSQIKEHHQIRKDAGMFDVSHMGILDLSGKEVMADLRYILANNIDRIVSGKALYTCMLNEQGGVIDDLIVYKIADDFFRLVVNAGTRSKDIQWLKQHLSLSTILSERTDLVMLALQGPRIQTSLQAWWPLAIKNKILDLMPFEFTSLKELFIARTGYTGEEGYEIIFPAAEANNYWQPFLELNIKPCGLAARDTLRLEAGLNLYGSDMDETVTPYESNLSWTVAMAPSDRQFIGRYFLEQQKAAGVALSLVGLVLEGPGIIRAHQSIIVNGAKVGEVTSGGYSPTLGRSIALARVPQNMDKLCFVEIRGKQVEARVVKPPFVKHGKKMI